MKASTHQLFQRLVVALQPNVLSERPLRAAAQFARIFRANLHGLLFEDDDILNAAALGISNEIVAGGAPRRFEVAHLEADMERIAHRLEQQLSHAAGSAELASSFQRLRGAADQELVTSVSEQDVIAIFEPRRPLDRVVGAYLSLRKAAFACRCPTLLLPPLISAQSGGVAVIPFDAADTGSISIAARIARETNARLEIWLTGKEALSDQNLETFENLPTTVHNLIDESEIDQKLLRSHMRLLVMSARAPLSVSVDAVLQSATLTQLPVLVVDKSL